MSIPLVLESNEKVRPLQVKEIARTLFAALSLTAQGISLEN